jgi:hypothetical protein
VSESNQNPTAQEAQEPQNARREFLRSGAKLAYIIPAVVTTAFVATSSVAHASGINIQT